MSQRIAATARAGFALALLATTFAAIPADAGRGCPLLRDRPGDGGSLNNWGGDLLPNDRSLDLLRVDVSSDASRLLAVIRVVQLSRTIDQIFEVRLKAAGTPLWLRAHVSRRPGTGTDRFLAGTAEDVGERSAGEDRQALGPVHGWVDPHRSTISMLVSTSQLRSAATVSPGTALTDVHGRSWRDLPESPVGADWTDTSARHVFGSGGCTPLPRR